MPSTSPRSPTPLALRRPSHGQTVAFARPPDASCWPTLSNGVHNPSVLNEETGEAIVLVKPEGSCLMHRGDRFSHTGTVTLTNRNVVRKSARLIVLVNPVRGLFVALHPLTVVVFSALPFTGDPPMSIDEFGSFASRVLAKHRARAADTPVGARPAAATRQPDLCVLLLAHRPEPAAVVGAFTLVPFNQGGPVEPSNLRMACKACAVERGARDLLAWEELAGRVPATQVDALKEERLKVLKRSDNHLTSAGHYAKPSTVLAHLQERWKHPGSSLT